jgi:hypothetical protein
MIHIGKSPKIQSMEALIAEEVYVESTLIPTWHMTPFVPSILLQNPWMGVHWSTVKMKKYKLKIMLTAKHP